ALLKRTLWIDLGRRGRRRRRLRRSAGGKHKYQQELGCAGQKSYTAKFAKLPQRAQIVFSCAGDKPKLPRSCERQRLTVFLHSAVVSASDGANSSFTGGCSAQFS